MNAIERLSRDPRVTVRRSDVPDAGGDCVIYWMQRAQRAFELRYIEHVNRMERSHV